MEPQPADPAVGLLTSPGAPFAVVRGESGGLEYADGPRTLREFVETTWAYGDTPFLIAESGRLTYGEFFAEASALARRFVDVYGLRPGDRAVVAMRNHPEWQTAFWAAQLAGLVAVPLNAWWTMRRVHVRPRRLRAGRAPRRRRAAGARPAVAGREGGGGTAALDPCLPSRRRPLRRPRRAVRGPARRRSRARAARRRRTARRRRHHHLHLRDHRAAQGRRRHAPRTCRRHRQPPLFRGALGSAAWADPRAGAHAGRAAHLPLLPCRRVHRVLRGDGGGRHARPAAQVGRGQGAPGDPGARDHQLRRCARDRAATARSRRGRG